MATHSRILAWEIPWTEKPGGPYCLPTPVFLGLPGGSAGKESACGMGDLGSMPGLQRSPGEGNSHPHQCSGLKNSVDCIVHGVAKGQTRPSDFRPLVAAPGPWSTRSTAVAHWRGCPEARGPLPDHGDFWTAPSICRQGSSVL